MIIPKIPYYLLGLKGLLTLSHRILELLKSRHPGEVFIQSSVEKLEAAHDYGAQVVGASRKAYATKTVTTADDDRDDSYESLKQLVRAGLKRSNPDFREKCARLYAILEKNDIGLARLPYDQETAALHALFRDMDKAEAQADLAAINALAWYTELKTNQIEFEAAVQERGAERAELDVPTSREAIKELIPVLKHLFKVMDVAEEGEHFGNVSETVVRLNALINEVVLAYRRGAGGGEDDEGDKEEEP